MLDVPAGETSQQPGDSMKDYNIVSNIVHWLSFTIFIRYFHHKYRGDIAAEEGHTQICSSEEA